MKFKVILTIFAFLFVFFLSTKISTIETFALSDTLSTSSLDCNNPSSQDYNTPECIEQRLGLNKIQADTIFIPRDPNSLIIVVFRIILASIVTLTAYRLAILGFQFHGASDSPDKKSKLFSKISYTLIGLVFALSALGITFLVQNIFLGKTLDDQIIKCDDLPANASLDLRKKCEQILPTPSP